MSKMHSSYFLLKRVTLCVAERVWAKLWIFKDVNAFIPRSSDFLFIEQAHIRAEFDADAVRNSSHPPPLHPTDTQTDFPGPHPPTR
jgi:hypothetical protein